MAHKTLQEWALLLPLFSFLVWSMTAAEQVPEQDVSAFTYSAPPSSRTNLPSLPASNPTALHPAKAHFSNSPQLKHHVSQGCPSQTTLSPKCYHSTPCLTLFLIALYFNWLLTQLGPPLESGKRKDKVVFLILSVSTAPITGLGLP